MSERGRGERVDAGAGALWASACVIAALLVVQAGRLGGPGGPAYAGPSPATVADLTALTPAAGDSEEVLCVVDRRAETMYVYGVVNNSRVDLLQAVRLGDLFAQARAAQGGRRP